MKEGAIRFGGVQFPLDAEGEFVMEILYVIEIRKTQVAFTKYVGHWSLNIAEN